ncbi:hypothetical protein [Shimazuella kribbensis]|uniref:hypothetical protein n=1 Tax=Shimazuella kribbensis TaxID=139808 RepID=UPI000418DB8E|nr:hypothetical protein [Shimazuella kribbensis]
MTYLAVFMAEKIDVFKWFTNIGYQILGVLTVFILVVIGIKGMGLLHKMALPALLTLIVGAIILVLFTSGSASKDLIEQLAQSILDYAKGN